MKGFIIFIEDLHKISNTDIVFDIRNTPSEMGAFSEYIRTKKDSVRSFHPFTSWAAIGKNANDKLKNEIPFPHSYQRIRGPAPA